MSLHTIKVPSLEQLGEVAVELGRSEGAIKQLQFRAVESLRARMEGGHA